MKNGVKIVAFAMAAAVSFCVAQHTVKAASVSESCFTFSAGTITNYDTYGPGCAQDPDIPSTIGVEPVTTIGEGAFQYKSLTAVTLPASVTSIGNDAFEGNHLVTVSIPGSVTQIGNDAFRSNDLTSVHLAEGITTIGNLAFYANRITALTLPGSLTATADQSFAENEITSLTLSNGITTIGEGSFLFNRLSSVIIPSSVTSIGQYAFAANNPDHSPWEMDSATITPEEYFDGVIYVQLYTEDQSNPASLEDEMVLESVISEDATGDGDTQDSLGGHIINPVHVEVSYQNDSGQSLHTAEQWTGAGLTDYSANQNQDPIRYYHLNHSYDFTAPAITGYRTPEVAQVQMNSLTTNYRFIYASETITGSSQAITTHSATETLANTGAATEWPALLGCSLLGLAAIILITYKNKTNRFRWHN